MIEGFRMDLDTLEEFYTRCMARNANTEAERLAIMRELVGELRAIKLNEKDIKNQLRGKKVLHVKRSPTNED